METRLDLLPPDSAKLWEAGPAADSASFSRHVIFDRNRMSGHDKSREIWAPNEAMHQVHTAFLGRLRALGIAMPYATGGRPGASPVRNVEPHSRNRYFYLLDLKSAYDQVEPAKLAQILAVFDPENTDPLFIEGFLRRFCIHPRGSGLLTGAPSSPELFNIYLLPLDDQLGEFAEHHGLAYTRYLDDLTFSSPNLGKPEHDRIGKRKRQAIRTKIEDAGLRINHQKGQVADLATGPIVITGLQLNPSGKWQMSTRYQKRLAKQLDELESATLGNQPLTQDQRAVLAGINGILRASIDRRRAIYTAGEHKLLRSYERIARRDKRLRAKTG